MIHSTEELKNIVNDLLTEGSSVVGSALEYIARAETLIEEAYEGRSMFELIQNARDASQIAGEDGEIWFQMDDRALNISNTGAAFTKDGIKAITTVGESTKHSSDTIGFKGIGFKSIRQLTDTPRVITEHGSFYFDVNATRTAFPNIKAKRLPLFWLPHFDATNLTSNELAKRIVTKVELPLRDSTATEWVKRNFEDLDVKQLIFLGHIKHLSLESPGYKRIFRVESNREKSLVLTQVDDKTHYFRLYFPTTGVAIPKEEIAGLGEKEREIVADMQQADIRVLLELDSKSKFRPIEEAELYLFYPLNIVTGFRFLIHSYFLVNPQRTELRPDNKLNTYLLKKVGEFIGGDMLAKLKRAKLNTNEILLYKREQPKQLASLYDATNAALKEQAFIYSKQAYYRPDEVIMTSTRLAKLLPTKKVGGRFLVAASPAVREWLRKEFNVAELTTKNLAELLELECEISKHNKNWEFFDVLYTFLCEDDAPDLSTRKILLTQNNKLVAGSEIDIFFPNADSDKIELPKSLSKRIPILHKRFKSIHNAALFIDKTNIKEYTVDALADVLVGMMGDGEELNPEIFTTLFRLGNTRIAGDLRAHIWLPIQGGQWVQPLKSPVYYDIAELREVYPNGNFLDGTILHNVEIQPNEQYSNFLTRAGVWDIPGLYIGEGDTKVDANDSRYDKLQAINNFMSPYFIRNDRYVDIPERITPWFSKQIIENWLIYRTFLSSDVQDLPMYYRGNISYWRNLDPTQKLDVSDALHWLRDRAWVVINEDGTPVRTKHTVIVNASELSNASFSLLQHYLDIIPISLGTQGVVLNDLNLVPLNGQSIYDFQRLLNLIYKNHKNRLEGLSTEDALHFKKFYNSVLTKLYHWWSSSRKPDLTELRNNYFLAVNEITNQLQWVKPEAIYYIDNPGLYEQLSPVLREEFQPQFTKLDSNQFGKIAQILGQKISDKLAFELKNVSDASRIALATLHSSNFIGCLSLIDKKLEEQVTVAEIEQLASVQVQLSDTVLVAASVNGEEIDSMELPYFLEKANPLILHLQRTKDDNQPIPNDLGRAISEVFQQVIIREARIDWLDLQSLFIDYLESANGVDFLRRKGVTGERKEDLLSELNHQGIAPKIHFWQAIRMTKGLLPVSIESNSSTQTNDLTAGLSISEKLRGELDGKFDYKKLVSKRNYSLLSRLLKEANIDLATFRKNLGIPLDFSAVLQNDWSKLLSKYKLLFTNWLYSELEGSTAPDSITLKQGYISSLDRYHYLTMQLPADRLVADLEEQFQFRVQTEFPGIPALNALESKEARNDEWLNNRYKEAEAALRSSISPAEIEHLNEFLKFSKYRSLLYFSEVKKAKSEFKTWVSPFLKKAVDKQKSSTGKNLLKTYTNPAGIFVGQTSVAPDAGGERESNGKSGSGNRVNGASKNQGNAITGRIAEHRVYMLLREQFADVRWVSHNAVEVGLDHPGFNQEGGDSAGCDIIYKDIDGKEVNVEVKGRTSADSTFYISRAELKAAIGKGKHYKLFFVTDALDNEKVKIYDLGNPFPDGDDKSLLSSTRFRAEIETARISFTLGGTTQS